ncbi:cupredoxin domain-containing protein [Paraburkholderia unamae]|uniref:Plastocyanin n=1 Tax=Paraburkholderia unamae TaxID=219649 RepID=A0ABX5KU65_9BURK|nr:cupredoxin family copper-binding protein [Paraburkholderia unamae]PVX85565.1 plastocyanin [Paraburkholderia unamae]
MNRLALAARGAAATACIAVAGLAVADPAVITIEQMQFAPPSVTIHVGDTVMWVNRDLVTHNVSEKAKGFDSGSIAPAGSWRYTATRPGHYYYTCRFHPAMRGIVIVEPK